MALKGPGIYTIIYVSTGPASGSDHRNFQFVAINPSIHSAPFVVRLWVRNRSGA